MLTDFLKGLFEDGKLKVEKKITDFDSVDEDIALDILDHYFENYKFAFPHSSELKFNSNTCIWALKYLYRLSQALLIRELSEEEVQSLLPKYAYGKSRDEVLSVDLIFQFIPQLYRIIEELSPSDILSDEIKQLSNDWGFSLFEIAEDFTADYIENDDILLEIFCNRIIENKCNKAIVSLRIKNQILVQLGDHKDYFWKDLKFENDAT